MGEAYQIRDQEMPFFLTFQVVGWADVFTRKIYRDLILENLTYCKKEKGIYVFGYVIMSNHLHLIVQQRDGKLSDWICDFKKFTSKSFPMAIGIDLEGIIVEYFLAPDSSRVAIVQRFCVLFLLSLLLSFDNLNPTV